jgi:hypothetical protein
MHIRRQCWDLPNEQMMQNTGKDWLLVLVPKLNEIQRMMTLMVLSRAWHVHNELTHDKPAPPTEASRRFLCSYVDTLLLIRQAPGTDACKGKEVISYSGRTTKNTGDTKTKKQVKNRERPTWDQLKLNVDGSYLERNGEAGAGMILRDHEGEVIFAACRSIT